MENFSEVPINVVIDRVNKGRAVLTELSELYRMKSEYEEQCAASLMRISKRNLHESEISGGSAERALGNMKNYLLFSGREHEAFSRALKDQLPHILEDIVSHQNDRSMVHKLKLQECMKNVSQSLDLLEQVRQQSIKSRSDLSYARKKVNDAQNQSDSPPIDTNDSTSSSNTVNISGTDTNADPNRSLSPAGKNFSSILRSFGIQSGNSEKSSSRTLFNSDSATNDIRVLHDRMAHCEEQNNRREVDRSRHKAKVISSLGIRDDAIKHASYFYHDLECSRLNALKWSLQQFIRLEKIHLDARRSYLDRLDTVVQEMDPLDDVHMFVTANRNSDMTYMYAHALSILDWARRGNDHDVGLDEGNADVRIEFARFKDKLKIFIFDELVDELNDNQPTDQVSNAPVTNWDESSFKSHSSRLILLQILNKQRVSSQVSSLDQFNHLVHCMRLFLDACLTENDFKSGLGMLTMINTFYWLKVTETEDGLTKSIKVYAQDELNSHGLWLATSQFESDGRRTGFWEHALLISIKDQATNIVNSRSVPIDWDDLDHDLLREEVGKVHYAVFMQISNLVCHMKNVNLTTKYIISFVLDMSQRTQLPDSYLETIFKSMHTTPEVIAEVIKERKASYVLVEGSRQGSSNLDETKAKQQTTIEKEADKVAEVDSAKDSKSEMKDFDLI